MADEQAVFFVDQCGAFIQVLGGFVSNDGKVLTVTPPLGGDDVRLDWIKLQEQLTPHAISTQVAPRFTQFPNSNMSLRRITIAARREAQLE